MSLPTKEGETLADVSATGRMRPWTERKRQARAIAASYIRIGKRERDQSYEKAGARTWTCGDVLDFAVSVDQETGELVRTLEAAHFCRDRLCPMCQWRKSLVTYAGLMRCMSWVDEHEGETVPVFLTLTVRNVMSAELGDAIGALSAAWTRLMKSRGMSERVMGYFRAIEVTYSADRGDWHPHIHAVLVMPASYLGDPALYLDQQGWVDAWRAAARLDYQPIVDVRVLRSEKGRADAVAEASKYAVKPGAWLSDDEEETDRHVKTLREALRGRRLTSWGGVLKEAKKALQVADADEDGADLVHTGAEEDGAEAVALATETYRWSPALSDYVCVSMVPEPGVEVVARGDPGGGRRARAA